VKYITTITPIGAPLGGQDRDYEVEIVDEEEGMVLVDGQEYRIDLRQIRGLPLYSLLLDQRSYELHVQQTDRNGYRVTVAGEGYLAHVMDERTHRLSQTRSGLTGAGVDSAVKAPIPGLVVKVNVKEGDEVKAGQSLVILEAMKMENELRAPRNGTVSTVHVRPGDSVNQGETLVTLH
jgi:biotin carboxyl carrier protein